MDARADGSPSTATLGKTPPPGSTAERGRSRAIDPRFAGYRATGDRGIRNALIESHLWLGQHCARRFALKGEPDDDLEQVAMVGLLKAVERFDPDRGFVFSTFAVPTIVGELRRHFRDRTWAVRVPRRAKESYAKVKTVADDLHQVLGRSPTVPEIAQRADLSIEDTLDALEVGGSYRSVPLDPAEDDDGDRGVGEAGRLGVEDPGYAASEARTMIPALLAALPNDRERQIVKLRFVDNMTQSQIAARFGVSQVHVSRLLRASLDRMRRQLTTPCRS
jgi:RNA polymerase sigma-B factor